MGEELYLIDLSYLSTPAELVFDLTSILDDEKSMGKKVRLKLGNIDLNKSQLLSINSLINSVNSVIVVLNGQSEITKESAMSLGIVYESNDLAMEEAYNSNQNIVEKYNSLEITTEESIVKNTEKNNEIPEKEEKKEEKIEVNIPNALKDYQNVTEKNMEVEQTANEKTEALDIIYDKENKLKAIFGNEVINEEKFSGIKNNSDIEAGEFNSYNFELESFNTKCYRQTISTGQYISYDGNIVIFGDCKQGSEIVAKGDITVWGELAGSAFAGSEGNEKAVIRALKMNAEMLRISGQFIKKPMFMEENNENKYIPEEARLTDGNVVVYKMI